MKFRTEFRALRLFYEQDVGTIKAMQFATAAIEPQLESNGNFNLPSVSKLYDMVGYALGCIEQMIAVLPTRELGGELDTSFTPVLQFAKKATCFCFCLPI